MGHECNATCQVEVGIPNGNRPRLHRIFAIYPVLLICRIRNSINLSGPAKVHQPLTAPAVSPETIWRSAKK